MDYTVGDVAKVIEDLAPLATAESWDNVGLLLGDRKQVVKRITLSLDFDDQALDLAIKQDCQLIVTHHPVIFPTIDRITSDSRATDRILRASRAGIAIYSAHTNLDACPGGVNDALAAVLGFYVEEAIVELDPSLKAYAHQDPLKMADVATSLKGKFDIPEVGFGFGRICTLRNELTRYTLVRLVNNQLQTAGCILNFDLNKKVKKIALSGGSFDEAWMDILVKKRVDLLITGEIKHHVLKALADRDIAVIMAGHEATERVILHPLANYIALRLPGLAFDVHEGIDYNKVVI